jgi:hypothetical protein
MTVEDRVRQALEPLADQLRHDLSSRIAATVERLNAELVAERSDAVVAAVAEARTTIESDLTERLTARFDAERADAVAAAAHDAAAAAERAVTARLTEELEIERVAAVAQAAADAAFAAEQSTTDRLTRQFNEERANTVAQVARETAESVERAVTERLTTLHESDRASAVSITAEETWVKAEREITDRVIANLTERHTQSKAEAEAAELAASRRIVDAVRALDNCRALSDVLHTLAAGAAAEAARTALLLVEPDRFRGSRSTGFSSEARELLQTVEPDGAGIIAEAARTGRAAIAADGLRPPAFAGLPDERTAIAVPLVLTGRVVGVLYADQGVGPVSARPTWQAALEILVRHGSRVLEALTAARLAEAATGRSITAPVPENESHRANAGQAGSWN